MKTRWFCAAAAAALALTVQPALAQPAKDLTKAPGMGTWGFDLAGRQAGASPGDSFYRYANGGYMDRLVIPADRSTYGAFNALDELSRDRMRAVADKAAADRSSTGQTAKVGALYRSFIDEARVEALGAKPLAADLARVRTAKTHEDIAYLMGATQKGFGGSMFSAAIYDDAKDPLKYAVYLGQAGLGLPDRDYYLEGRFATQKAAYETYVAKVLGLAGWANSAVSARAEAKALFA